jgi:hypothetical protein
MSNYFKLIDTLKPYKITGKYCIIGRKDTILGNDMGIIGLHVFDRINRTEVNGGVIGFYSSRDTIKVYFDAPNISKEMAPGRYKIYVGSLKSIGVTTKEIEIRKDTRVDLNVFLGSVLKW